MSLIRGRAKLVSNPQNDIEIKTIRMWYQIYMYTYIRVGQKKKTNSVH